MKSFAEVSKNKGFSENYYPHAEKGIKIATQFFINLERAIIFLIVALVFKIVTIFIAIDKANIPIIKKAIKSMSIPKKGDIGIGDIIQYLCSIGTKWIALITFFIGIAFLVISLLIFISYAINIIRRQRNYERSVIINDLRAFFLKRSILGAKDAKSVLKDIKRELQNKKSGDKRLTKKDRVPLLAQKELMKMQVLINSRESLDNQGFVDTQYRIICKVPNDDDVKNEWSKKIKGLGELATQQLRAKVTFGKQFNSEDYQYVIYRAWDQQADKYIRKEENDNEEKEDIAYEYSYPLSMLNDQQDKIDEKNKDAELFTKRNIQTVKSFLATSKIDCTFKEYEVGNAMASYIFTMADDVSLPHFDKLGDTLDNMMKIKGSAVALEEGNLIVSVPLPKDKKIPLNVPTMYRDLFG